MPGPYCGMEILLAVISATNGAVEGVQSKTYTKKGGKIAFKVEFEMTVNGLAGYNNKFKFVHIRDMVTLPLTTFNPKSRNATSKKSINVKVCTADAFGYGMNIND